MNAVEREEAAEKACSAGVSVDGEAGGGDLFEECVDVHQRGVRRLGLLAIT